MVGESPQMELNQIYCGDCMELFKCVPDDSVNLVVTSPPYNVGIDYDNYNDDQKWDDYYKWCERWMREVYRVLTPDGRFCLNHYLSLGQSNNRHSPLMDLNCTAVDKIWFYHHGLAVWMDITITKRTAWGSWLSASAPYINSPLEGILILYKDHWKLDRRGESTVTKAEFMEACSGLWKIQPERNREFPAPFPVALPARCINMFTYRGDVVLDPFMGSGTTAVAAKQLDRKFIGFDISERYCKMARDRLSRTSSKLSQTVLAV